MPNPHSATRPIPMHQRCERCKVRYKQFRGLCRRCWVAEGGITLTTIDRDAARLQRQRGAPVQRVEERERPAREVHIDGVLYEVVFDGTRADNLQEIEP